jgi:hypothetical protein
VGSGVSGVVKSGEERSEWSDEVWRREVRMEGGRDEQIKRKVETIRVEWSGEEKRTVQYRRGRQNKRSSKRMKKVMRIRE